MDAAGKGLEKGGTIHFSPARTSQSKIHRGKERKSMEELRLKKDEAAAGGAGVGFEKESG